MYTIKEFQPFGDTFDETYKFVGPSISAHVKTETLILLQLKKKSDLYFIRYCFNEAIDFYKLCMKAFENNEHTIVMSIGNKTKISNLGEILKLHCETLCASNRTAYLYETIYYTRGMNSTHEGLYNGVLLVVIPQSADQPAIAKQVESLGAGVHYI